VSTTIAYPPGPSGLGSIDFFRTRRRNFAGVAKFLTETARCYGQIAHWRAGPRHIFLLDDPALIEELLVTRARDFMKGVGAQRLRLLMGDGLVTSEPPLHLRQRRMIQPAFHRDRIAAHAARMARLFGERAAQWREGEIVQIDREMAQLALSVVVETMFGGADIGDAGEVGRALGDTQPGLALTMGPLTQFFPTAWIERSLPFFRMSQPIQRFLEGRRRLEAIVDRFIDAREESGGDGSDLLSMLLAARDENGAPMSRRQARDEAMTIFLAGHETTAVALTWTWYLLSLHPHAETCVREEIARVIGTREPLPGDVPALTYTRDVVAESMRLYPPVWNLVRRSLRDTQLGPWQIPKGANVLASQLVTHRNPRLWKCAEEFRPERWRDEARDLPKFAYFPFGGGNRMCIGESFAWTEAILAVAAIARRWRLELVDRTRLEIEPMVTLRPSRPVLMRVLR